MAVPLSVPAAAAVRRYPHLDSSPCLSTSKESARGSKPGGGGYEIVHSSPGLEIGVYVLVAPEPDRQQPHEVDEVYFVLEGRGAMEIEGEIVALQHGQAAFVPAGADHRFTGYEQMSVLVTFAGSSGIGSR